MRSAQSAKIVNIVIAVIILAAVVLSYFYLQGGAPAVESIPPDSKIANIKANLRKLESITLDRTVVESGLFHSLEDISIPIPSQPAGTENPFGTPPF